jgi:DeoR family fructose operon transcriptional repressor
MLGETESGILDCISQYLYNSREGKKRNYMDLFLHGNRIIGGNARVVVRRRAETDHFAIGEFTRQGADQRTGGEAGAVKLNLERSEPSHLSREVMRAEEKRRIGRAAAEMVQDNDTIVIDEGTTPLQMISYLSHKKDLTILTSSITALNLLIEHQNGGLLSAEVYFLGGKVNPKHHRVGGSFAERMMKEFFVDKAFLSVDGLLIHKGITCYDPERAVLAKRFIENANESIILADHSKIGTSTLCKVAELKEIDIVISDVMAPEEWNRDLQAHNVAWLLAE